MGSILRGMPLTVALFTVPVSALAQSSAQLPGVSVDTLDGGRVLVRNPPPQRPDDGDLWSLLETLRLGRLEGSGPDVFGDIQDITVDLGGNIYVIDAGWKEVRVFGRQGRHVRRMAGEGDGPGEKRYSGLPHRIAWEEPNRLWVSDGAQRLTLDSIGNELNRVVLGSAISSSGPADPRVRVVAAETGTRHSVLYLELTSYTSPADLNRGASLEQQVSVARVWLSDEYEVLAGDTLAIETMPLSLGERRETLRGSTTIRLRMAHPREPRVAWGVGHDGTVWLAHRATYRLHEITFTGDTIRTVELGSPITLADVGREQAEFEPVLAALDVSPEGWLWVRREPKEGRDESFSSWDILDNCGRYRGVVTIPWRVRAVHIGAAGEVHAVVVGTLGISHVLRLQLESRVGETIAVETCRR